MEVNILRKIIQLNLFILSILILSSCGQENSSNNTMVNESSNSQFTSIIFETNSLDDVHETLINDSYFEYDPTEVRVNEGFTSQLYAYRPNLLSPDNRIGLIAKDDMVYDIKLQGDKDSLLSVLDRLIVSSEFEFIDYNLTNTNSNMDSYIDVVRNKDKNVFISIYSHPTRDEYEIDIAFVTEETISELTYLMGINFYELVN